MPRSSAAQWRADWTAERCRQALAGSAHLDRLGYRKLGQMLEHRLVMELQLGRALLPDESVHHINGLRSDNRLENLELWSRSHPAGQRVADKVRWARQILALYEEAGPWAT